MAWNSYSFLKQANAKELENMIVNELNKIDDCQGIKTIGISPQEGQPNWRPSGFVNF